MLLDSNIFIYAIQPQFASLREWCLLQPICASDISRLEVLGYHHLSDLDRRDLTELFTITSVYPVSNSIISRAISLRQQRKMSLGDAVIAATALEHQQVLATRNVADFDWIDGLSVVNPIKVKD